MVSIYTYLTFLGRNGVHLHIFQFWGPEWCPFTHISNLGPGNGVHLHIFQFWGRKWCPFTHISNLGAGNGVHLHIFQIWAQVWVK